MCYECILLENLHNNIMEKSLIRKKYVLIKIIFNNSNNKTFLLVKFLQNISILGNFNTAKKSFPQVIFFLNDSVENFMFKNIYRIELHFEKKRSNVFHCIIFFLFDLSEEKKPTKIINKNYRDKNYRIL